MGHQTSVSVEDEFWSCLKEIAKQEEIKVCNLITKLDVKRSGNLSSAIRLYVLEYLQKQLQEYKKKEDAKKNSVNRKKSKRGGFEPMHQEPNSSESENASGNDSDCNTGDNFIGE